MSVWLIWMILKFSLFRCLQIVDGAKQRYLEMTKKMTLAYRTKMKDHMTIYEKRAMSQKLYDMSRIHNIIEKANEDMFKDVLSVCPDNGIIPLAFQGMLPYGKGLRHIQKLTTSMFGRKMKYATDHVVVSSKYVDEQDEYNILDHHGNLGSIRNHGVREVMVDRMFDDEDDGEVIGERGWILKFIEFIFTRRGGKDCAGNNFTHQQIQHLRNYPWYKDQRSITKEMRELFRLDVPNDVNNGLGMWQNT